MVPTILREMSAAHRTTRGDTRLGVTLAFVAGAVNAGGLLAVGTYTSHMSGMVSSVADFAAAHQWLAAGLVAVHIAAFFCGSLASAVLINWGRLKHIHSEFALPLMIEAGLLLLFGAVAVAGMGHSGVGLNVLISLLCLIMGLQNGLITKISHAEIRTTHMTGVITDLGIEAGRFLFGKCAHAETRFDAGKTRRLAWLLAAFLGGGIVGALAFKAVGFIAVVPFALALAVIALMPLIDDLDRTLSPRR